MMNIFLHYKCAFNVGLITDDINNFCEALQKLFKNAQYVLPHHDISHMLYTLCTFLMPPNTTLLLPVQVFFFSLAVFFSVAAAYCNDPRALLLLFF